ncbi:MAG: hypothetical protein SPJ63_07265 [Oscillospiraceae bacterium]|nr:hypothetical protein [Oscillospiraceae bacterium]
MYYVEGGTRILLTISGRRYPDGGDSVPWPWGMPFVLYDGSAGVGYVPARKN